MFYLRWFNRMRHWEDSYFKKNPLAVGFGSLALFMFGFAIPLLSMLLLGWLVVGIFGVNERAFMYVFFSVPAAVSVSLLYFGE